MTTYFKDAKTVEELRKQYRELLRKYHPDNENGSTEITQQINAEYDRLFAILSKEKKSDKTHTYDENEENEAFKEVLKKVAHINADIEIIGSWLWVHSGYEYKELLKEAGFKFAPKKKCWCWHFGEYKRHHSAEASLEDIRLKYGSQTVSRKSEQYALS